jgi:hypothetical protein
MTRTMAQLAQRHLKRSTTSKRFDRSRKQPNAYNFVIRRMQTFGNGQSPIPARVTLLHPYSSNFDQAQLFIDHLPIPRDAWSFDAHDRVLTWQGAYGGGRLYVHHGNQQGAIGTIGSDPIPCAVSASTTWSYTCNAAKGAGVELVSSGGQVTGLSWDSTTDAWKQAGWETNRFQITLTHGDPPITGGPGPLEITIQDLVTQADPFNDNSVSGSTLSLTPIMQNGQIVSELNFKPIFVPPDLGSGSAPSDLPTVYPHWLQYITDSSGNVITGAMTVGSSILSRATLVGIQGQPSQPTAMGYYRTDKTTAPFGVFQGRLVLDGKPVAASFMAGDRLYWQNLDSQQQQRMGLPASGCLQFCHDGSSAFDSQQQVNVQRLSSTVALDALSQHADLHPTVHQQGLALRQSLSDNPLSILELLSWTPFQQDSQGNWQDAVQRAVTQDMSTIMNSFVPADLWKLTFPGSPQPTLSGYLAQVANTPVPGITSAADWYASLAVAVLTEGLAGGSDPNCQYLNGPRAANWLKTQMANSAVYQYHSKLLFNYEWLNLYGRTALYLNDQNQNASAYQAKIQQLANAEIADIQANVVPSSDDPNVVTELIARVNEAKTFALNENLYWAYCYYTYVTSPGYLVKITASINPASGSTDGTEIARAFQSCIAVLTALDPDGTFATQYAKTINLFLTTNILPSMYDFTQNTVDPDTLKQYLQTLMNTIQDSGNQNMAATLAFIQTLLASETVDSQISAWTSLLSALASTASSILDLSFVEDFVTQITAQVKQMLPPQFVEYANQVAECFAGVFTGGMAALGVYNLVENFKSWTQLTPAEQSNLITNAVQLGLQILGGIAQRSIRAAAMFTVGGMTTWQRVAAIGKIVITGEADDLNQGLVKIGSTLGRWLADTEGSVGKILGDNDDLSAMMERIYAQANEEEASLATRVFGSNLEEFMVTRVGTLFILAGIGYSLYNIIDKHEAGIPLALDVLSIVGGALTLFAFVGTWDIVIEAGGLLAEILSVAGPLSILAAIAGIALMIYELFQTPPEDPIQIFVDSYVKPAGFAVAATASSIDYVSAYNDPNQNNLRLTGLSLAANGQTLCCNNDGAISLTPSASTTPANVWQVQTDGAGMSQIYTVAQPAASQSPVVLLLSQMSDGSVSFQPKMPASTTSQIQAAGSAPTVVTQLWYSTPQGTATVNSNGNLVALPLIFQPALPDSNGNYAPSQASGYLAQTSSGVTIDANQGTTFTLTMMGIQPNFINMRDMNFLLNTVPSTAASFGPSFGLTPSTPLTFTLGGDPLPAFLSFDPKTGLFSPNGGEASTAATTKSSLTVQNNLGHQTVNFLITIAAAATPEASANVMLQPS